MSEKRRQKQQRRQRRKAKGASRAQARAVDRVFAQLVRIALASMSQITTALEAERWASSLLGEWRREALPDEDPVPGLVQAFEAIGTAPALASLRALSAIGAPGARAAADRLVQTGQPEPEWAAALGESRPTAAALLEEPVFDDGLRVVIEFDDSYALDVFIDHNRGGLVSDVFVGAPLAEVRQHGDFTYREIELDEARARVLAALSVLDRTLDPPVDADVYELRAMLDARLRLLPDGFELPDERAFVDREALVADFLAATEGTRWRGDVDAEFVVRHAVDFGADVNHGGPLRWSPGTVEIFMTGWLPDQVMAEPEFFSRVPEILRDWVRYAARCRGVPDAAKRDAVEAVDDYREDLLNAVADPDAWSLAEALADAALEAGIDPTDDAALARFMRDQAP